MYRYLDKPLNTSNASEKFIVWVLRGWAAAVHSKKCPRHFLRSGFSHKNGEQLFQLFSAFMGILHAGQKRHIHFCNLTCPRISDDEALLLAVFSGLEADNSTPAKSIFKDMLKPTEARHAMTMSTRLVVALNREGYSLIQGKQPN